MGYTQYVSCCLFIFIARPWNFELNIAEPHYHLALVTTLHSIWVPNTGVTLSARRVNIEDSHLLLGGLLGAERGLAGPDLGADEDEVVAGLHRLLRLGVGLAAVAVTRLPVRVEENHRLQT